MFHDTRHSAVTNFVARGVLEVAAMSVTVHWGRERGQTVNVRRDDVQRAALDQPQNQNNLRLRKDPSPVVL